MMLGKIIGVTGIRILLSMENHSPFYKVLDCYLIPVLLEYAANLKNEKLAFEAIWCLTNIASNESLYVLKLIECDAVKQLISIIKSEASISIKEQAIWCLGNISGDSPQFRDLIIREGAIPLICHLLSNAPPDSSFARNASWTLANFGKGQPQIDIVDFVPAIHTLTKILGATSNQEILSDICWAFSYVTDDGGDERILPFVEANTVQVLL